MNSPLAYLKNLSDDWLFNYNSREFQRIAEELYLELTQLSKGQNPPKIVLAEPHPVRFLAVFIAACAANCQIFLCNHDWVKQEWKQVLDLVEPDVIWEAEGAGGLRKVVGTGKRKIQVKEIASSQTPLIMIPTGGSSGKIKFAIHTWQTLVASVEGFTKYFGLNQVNSFCVLPLYHVSGLMQFMRSFITKGKLSIAPFKEVTSGKIYDIESSKFFISLVPTQLQWFLQNPQLTEWLAKFETVLLGGAPAWNELLEKARYYKIRLAPTYGMTETASQIATLKPDDFLNGKVSSGKILPHAKVNICNDRGEGLNSNQIGNIKIQSQSLFLGYYDSQVTFKDLDNNNNLNYLQVDDLGFLDEEGYLNIIGRSNDKIITGGENVYPIEVESAIRATEMVEDVCVIGIPDEYWGQAVTAIYISKSSHTSTVDIQSLIKDKLSKFKIPKNWVSVSTLPRNAQGKINRQNLQQLALKLLNNHM
ncbi:2-succinylbenzoate--CoA ligase [Aetokthonos hydrillicola Thurmond2011]|uniref:2-succinylbenzoate--CoA ligase n=1 Tax=Aetokthonos hydrillicola Thurmond2011 TaxID=2712845 RepID=A0AAP5M5W2_9CYAN|nr:2-succinylbenzoate--CoA ligase [Aetokthonos hydrillicola]MBO3458180.1 2-succinylbenzoate--CoA ligase [Aetokthonos hydrillicola CCALA 1050]MBW4584400.1 2-succinylbenzoate--CoA ligase [Aetokthonos hydrillicola CCALA 1050]MDR9896361.1 2-succinylbenzoate--CoA ligase [Aetokthonos hydrillicola Thurmond2011]